MTPETPTSSSPPRRRFGVAALVAAAVASAVLAVGGTLLVGRRAGHDHAASEGAAKEAKEQYQCPMHPTIVQDHPGDCPICGMKLVKLAATPAAPAAGRGAAEQQPMYQCPMHPSIVQDHPGDCPICGMKLVKVESGEPAGAATEPAVEGLATVNIDPMRQQLIGLRTAVAKRGKVGGAWRTVGRVAIDETRVKHVNLKIPAYVERIYVDFVGRPVRRGEPLFSVYSPELFAAQDELLLALRTQKTLAGSAGMQGDGAALVEAARRKLELWDVPASEIRKLEQTGKTMKTLTFYSPISGVVVKKDVVAGMKLEAGAMPYEIVDLSQVWVLADVYESELRHVKVGMPATLTLKAFPDRPFKGKVSFVDPLLDPKTRTVKVRLAFANPTGDLRPEMFGEVVLQGAAREGLRIPADAVIDSGTQSVVFVSLAEGKFQPRAVQVGESDGTGVEIVAGLAEGEKVVTRANFLVDSESRLRASLAALAPSGGAHPAASPGAPAEGGKAGAAADPHAGHGGR